MAFVGICISYAIRFNPSIAIVMMVKSGNKKMADSEIDVDEFHTSINVSHKTESCPVIKPDVGEFSWDESTVGFVLSSFF